MREHKFVGEANAKICETQGQDRYAAVAEKEDRVSTGEETFMWQVWGVGFVREITQVL